MECSIDITSFSSVLNLGFSTSCRVDFNDIADEEDDNYDDAEDEEYRGEGRRLSGGGRDDEDHQLSDFDDESPVRSNRARSRGRGQRRSSGQQRNRRDNVESDLQEQTQPTRSSSRQVSRRTIKESEDDEEFFEEMVSTHTKPSGTYARDWVSADHFFKMPRDNDVNRKWLSRTNNQASHYGTKAYCPQVGDSIVYIPRAHYEILQKFPTGEYSAPWKSWPTTHQPWPVVRCKVVHVRYRFPYEMYYERRGRRKSDGIKDVAIILTLEITGVPYSCENRIFPWPAPVFTAPIASRTRSHESTFEVTMFDTGLADFVVPEFLYTWRVKGLEKAIESNRGELSNLSVSINFPPGMIPHVCQVQCYSFMSPLPTLYIYRFVLTDEGDRGYGSEDPRYLPYEANIIDFADSEDYDFHFQGSGFNALLLDWVDSESSDDADLIKACPWEVEAIDIATPNIPQMTSETKSAVNAALKQILNSDPKVKECKYFVIFYLISSIPDTDSYILFTGYDLMPDTRLYSDYLCMIEVPMYLQIIRQRLQNNYYTNKNSVVSDMELIKENCYKYNEDDNEFYALACEMHIKFKELVDAIPDDPVVDDPNDSDHETTIRRGVGVSRVGGAASAPGGSTQRSPNRLRRRLSQQVSSLANLPNSGERSLRRSTRSSNTANNPPETDDIAIS